MFVVSKKLRQNCVSVILKKLPYNRIFHQIFQRHFSTGRIKHLICCIEILPQIFKVWWDKALVLFQHIEHFIGWGGYSTTRWELEHLLQFVWSCIRVTIWKRLISYYSLKQWWNRMFGPYLFFLYRDRLNKFKSAPKDKYLKGIKPRRVKASLQWLEKRENVKIILGSDMVKSTRYKIFPWCISIYRLSKEMEYFLKNIVYDNKSIRFLKCYCHTPWDFPNFYHFIYL